MSKLETTEDYTLFKQKIDQYVSMDFVEKAISETKNMLADNENDASLYGLLGWLHYLINENERATLYANQALHMNEQEPLARVVLGYNRLKDKAYEEAEEQVLWLQNQNISMNEAKLFQAEFYLARHNPDQVLIITNEMITDDKKNDAVYLLQAKALIKLGAREDALKRLKKAKRLNDTTEVNEMIIKLLYQSDQIDECKKFCRRIILSAPNSDAATHAKKMLSKLKMDKQRQEASAQVNNDNTNQSIVRASDSLEDALDKLNKLIGLENVKREIQQIVQLIKFDKKRNEKLGITEKTKPSYHFAFIGNPGTGKTTVARLIGDIMYYSGVLEKGHLIETDRTDLVGSYIGHTEEKTKEMIESAQGGVLFVDEAYALASTSSNDFGKEAINTLIKEMEDKRGDFIVILAGYRDEMRDLIRMNPGFESRVNMEVIFDDYDTDELIDIAKFMAQEQRYEMDDLSVKAFLKRIESEQVSEHFANARAVRNIIEQAIREKAFRLTDQDMTKEELTILKPVDFGVDLTGEDTMSLQLLMKKMDSMVGLDEVKDMIRKIISFVNLQKKREEQNMNIEQVSLHLTFEGNPGTGKTTIARLFSQMLRELGVLKKGHIVEVTKDDLVAGYVGQTGPKTLKKIKEAYGGVLFIDEAYSLHGGSGNSFGSEAINTLIKEMEDHRDKFVVIMAGYSGEMKALLNTNPGLNSRFNYNIHFDDYSPTQLIEILKGQIHEGDYRITDEALASLGELFSLRYDQRDKNFGNGRMVRKAFEAIKMKQAVRLIEQDTSDDIDLIILDDVTGLEI